MGTVVRVKGIQRFRRKGKWYCYHRASGKRIAAEFGSADFFAELAKLDAAIKIKGKDAGTLGMATAEYRKSPFWADLSSATRLSYDRALAVLEPLDAMPLIEITPGFVSALRDQVAASRGRWMANYVVTMISILSDFARERDWMKSNPAKDIRRIGRDKTKPRANRPWAEAECRTVLDAAPPYLRVPIALAMFAGFRKGDVLRITKTAVTGGMVRHLTSKRGVDVAFPIHPTLANILSAAPVHGAVTIAATLNGTPWTESGFNSTFCKFIGRLEAEGKVAPGLTMHGLRHTVGTRLREAGADLDTIRRLLGQKTLGMAQHYSETADNSEEATRVVGRLRVLEGKKE